MHKYITSCTFKYHLGNVQGSSESLNQDGRTRSVSLTLSPPSLYREGNKLNVIVQNLSTEHRKRKPKKKQKNQSQRCQQIRAFQDRPLPSLTDQLNSSPYQTNQSGIPKSPFLQSNIFSPGSEDAQLHRKWLGRTRDYNKVKELLLCNSLENINAITQNPLHSMTAKRHCNSKPVFSEIFKLTGQPMKKCAKEEVGMRSIRSQSMDDECLSYNAKSRRGKTGKSISHNSFDGSIRVNEIYAEVNSVVEPPLGTYGTLEKNGYLQLPYDNHPRLHTSKEETMELPNVDGQDIGNMADDANLYDSIKGKASLPNMADDTHLYDSIKGKASLPNMADDTHLYDSVKVKASLPNMADEANLYDSIKGIPRVAFTKDAHAYAKILEIKPATENIQNRPIPKPEGVHRNDDPVFQPSAETSEQGGSIPKYERIACTHKYEEQNESIHGKIDNSIHTSKKISVVNASFAKGYTGIYMKFGEIVSTKI